jgi:hypothetical protein
MLSNEEFFLLYDKLAMLITILPYRAGSLISVDQSLILDVASLQEWIIM